MIFKLAIKIVFLAIEIFLGFYSLVMTDSLGMKFLFFAFTAVIIAFAITKLTNKILPSDIDSFPNDELISENYIEKKIQH
ncbi:hypothetical protein BC962_0899 [Gillisia mitskevichiae]|uniref:Uncharacterized protein n=1 Tax=Gillisia mitskevichiae TaxID=270921 RepID=A0A495PZH8_9FLAO|nr:hypothetical protein [Gillisia mitskevichiae]RKS55924.1 hypothetical protein BC962_0899 [Gillisia mitskevichiae]